MSYALDAGRGDNGLDELAQRWLGHKPLAFAEVAGQGKSFIGFARVPIERATEYAAEDADVILRLWRVLKPRLVAERMTSSMRRWSGRWSPCWRGWSGAASRSTARCCRGCRASSRRAWRGSRPRSTRSPAKASTSARRSSWATSCSARWACPAAPRPRPAPGRPRRARRSRRARP